MGDADGTSSSDLMPKGWKRWAIVVLMLAAVIGLLWGAWFLEESAKTTKAKVSTEGGEDQRFVVEMEEKTGDTVFIQCSEDEFEDAFQQFRESLGLEDPPLSVLGGPMIIAMAAADIPEDLQPAQRAVIEVLKRYSPSRIILLAHDECLLYDTIAAWNNRLTEARQRQLADLEKARKLLQEWLPKAKIEIYYAAKDGNRLVFNPLTPPLENVTVIEQPKMPETGEGKE